MPLLVAAAVLAVVVVRLFPPQPQEYRPAPYDRIKAHRHPGGLVLAVTVGVVGPVVDLYLLALGQLGVALVFSVYLMLAAMVTEAVFLR